MQRVVAPSSFALALAVTCATALPACDRAARTGQNGQNAAGRESLTCSSHDDCVLSCVIPDDCCGELCNCTRPYNRKAIAEIRKRNEAACPKGCDKVASCPAPTVEHLARCVDHACVSVQTPRLTSCVTDEQCVPSAWIVGECCPQPCAPWRQAYVQSDLDALEAWRSEHCDPAKVACPMAKCRPPSGDGEAKCVSGRCSAVEAP
jgi:hypothetical protein